MFSKKIRPLYFLLILTTKIVSQTFNWTGYPANSASWNPSANFNVTTSTSGGGSFDRRSSTGTGNGLVGTPGSEAGGCTTYTGLRLEMSGAGNGSGNGVWNNSTTVTITFPNFVCAPVTFNIYDITQTFYNDGSSNYVNYQDKVTISALDNSNTPVIPTVVLNGTIDNAVAGNNRVLTANALNGQCKNQAITVGTSGQQIRQITITFSNQDLPTHCPSPVGSPIRYGISQYQYIFISPITANPPPTATITSPAIPCGATATTLTGNTSASSPTYLWTGPSGSTISSPNAQSTAVSGAGVYTLTINPGGCGTTAIYTLNPTGTPPNVTAVASNTITCNATTAQAIASTTSSPVTYNWSGSGIVSGATSPSLTVNSGGVYNYTVTNTSSGCSTTGTLSIEDNRSPVAATSSISNSLSCLVNTAQATISTTVSPVSYNWSGPGIVAGGTSATATVNNSGTYNYTVTNTSNNCKTTGTLSVIGGTSSVLPTASANGSITCTNSNVALQGGPASLTYTWSGPGFSGGVNSQNAVATSTGIYTLTVSSPDGCTNYTTTSVSINTIAPTVSTGPTMSLSCSSTTVMLNGNSSTAGVTYNWAGPVNSIPAGTTPTNSTTIVSSSGTYTLTVSNPSNGCVNYSTQSVVSNTNITLPITPTITASGNNLCAGQTVTLTSSSVNNNLWNNGSTTQTIAVNSSGLYSVTVNDPAACSSSSASISITISSSPVNVSVPQNIVVCNGSSVSSMNFTSTVTGTTFNWQNSNPAIGLPLNGFGNIPSFTANNANSNLEIAIITVTPSASGCTGAPQSFTISVSPSLIVNAGPDAIICYGQPSQLSASPSNISNTYAWLPASTLNNPNIASPVSNASVTTIYTLTVTDANGCLGTDEVKLTATTSAVVTTSNSIFCSGNSSVLSASINSGSNSSYQYNWLPTSGLNNPTTLNPVANPSVTTVYTLTVTDGCSMPTVAQLTVTVIPTPVISISSQTNAGCAPLCVNFMDETFLNGSNIVNWSWNFGSQSNSSLQDPEHCFLQSGNYNVSLTVSDINGCTSTKTFSNYITVYPNPIADFTSPSEVSILESEVQFYDNSIGAVSWNWNFYDPIASLENQTSTIKDPIHYFENQGTYCVTLIVENTYGCTDSKYKCTEVKPDFTIYVPNAFTPDNNKINDVFTAVGINIIEFEMTIFDRWGEQIFYTNDINNGWNGVAKKGPDIAKQDVYVWKIRATDVFKKEHHLIGSVTLLR